MLKQKEPNKSKKTTASKFSNTYQSFCYKFMGKYLIKNEERYHNLQLKLLMANMKMTPAVYLSTVIITGLIVTLLSLFAFTFIFQILIGSSTWLLYTLLLVGITGGISFLIYPFIVSSKISSRRMQIDREIPFTLSELAILASTGLTPIKIFRNMTKRQENTSMNLEFRKIIYKIDIDGKDIITAVSETAKESPSMTFREVLWDLANMIHQGGDLDLYLRGKADQSMQLKRDIQKEFVEKLGMYSELYISLVLVGILFISIAAFLLDAMGSTIGGITSDSLLLLLSYGLIPVVIIVVNLFVSMAYSKSG